MSETAKRIKAIVDGGLAPVLKQAGFRRQSLTFFRMDGEALQVVNVQLNRWNTPESGSFTINAGVDIARVAELLPGCLPMPKNPKEYCCLLRVRVGMLMPAGKDHWWTVTRETNTKDAAEELVTVWTTYIAPWLERYKTVSSLTSEPDRGPMLHAFTRAAANFVMGDQTAAKQLIEAQIRQLQEHPSYAGPENAKLKETRLALCRKWLAKRGLAKMETP